VQSANIKSTENEILHINIADVKILNTSILKTMTTLNMPVRQTSYHMAHMCHEIWCVVFRARFVGCG